MQISTTANTTPVDDARLAEIHANPGFGQYFTDPVSYTHLTLPTNREV